MRAATNGPVTGAISVAITPLMLIAIGSQLGIAIYPKPTRGCAEPTVSWVNQVLRVPEKYLIRAPRENTPNTLRSRKPKRPKCGLTRHITAHPSPRLFTPQVCNGDVVVLFLGKRQKSHSTSWSQIGIAFLVRPQALAGSIDANHRALGVASDYG